MLLELSALIVEGGAVVAGVPGCSALSLRMSSLRWERAKKEGAGARCPC